jgi:NAD(P)-dependent dehydrogenase (short-subunit alcohol dehydrogenase family)
MIWFLATGQAAGETNVTKQFSGKVALVTGGNAGIGRATAVAFAKEGAKVIIAARREKESEAVLSEIRGVGSEGLYVRIDATEPKDLKAMVEQAVAAYARLDFAFNNAGVEEPLTPLAEKTEALYHQVMDTNVKGVLFSMQAEIPAMLESGGGVIVNMSSIAGLIGFSHMPIYAASKHAVLGMTKAVALEFAKQNIRVNAVCPGGIETEMYKRFVSNQPGLREGMAAAHPMGRVGLPEEIASAVIWLCSQGASFVTGQSIAIDGGYTAQ